MKHQMQKKTKKKNPKKEKVIKILLISLLVFTLLFICIFTYFMHLIFGAEKSYDTESLTRRHVELQNKVVKRLTDILYKSKPGKICILTLNQAEVNAIITAISNSDSLGEFFFSNMQIGEKPKKRPYQITFKQNRFDIKYSFPSDYNTPFGKHINISVSGTPELNRKGINLDIKSASAGDVPLPPRQVEKILHSLLSDYENDQTFKIIHEIVVRAYITQENNLVIYFYPYRIRKVLSVSF